MQKSLPYIAVTIVLIYAFYNAKFRTDKQIQTQTKKSSNHIEHIKKYDKDRSIEVLHELKTVPYLKRYIIHVINNGSSQLHFKKNEIMEGGYVSKEDAPKIACYVVELSGKKCKNPYPKDAALFFSSVCAGCHGEDGKGANGAYPDLTKEKLIGIEKREEFLLRRLK